MFIVCNVKINAFPGLSGAAEILDFDTFKPFRSCRGGYRVSYSTADTINSLVAKDARVLEILVFRIY
jgi:hypothetical protein